MGPHERRGGTGPCKHRLDQWGKRDEHRALPMNGSISLTIDQLYVTTAVTFDNSICQDRLRIDNRQRSPGDLLRVTNFFGQHPPKNLNPIPGYRDVL